MRLTGQKNQCAGCGKMFQSNHAFEKHRTGSFVPKTSREQRRCMSEGEMLAAGMVRKENGFWVGSVMPPGRFSLSESDQEGEVSRG